jgi:threonine/homoserine/homoserine lactone efflux protein
MQYIVTVLLGTLVGVLITVPLGPTSIYVAQRTLQGETRKGMLVAVGAGSMGWFLSLALFVRSRRHIISDAFVRMASSITALVIIGFGVYFTITIFQHLNGAT